MAEMTVMLEVRSIADRDRSEITRMWVGDLEVSAPEQSVSQVLGPLKAQGWRVAGSRANVQGNLIWVTYYLTRPALPD
jgi:hypothetical protein